MKAYSRSAALAALWLLLLVLPVLGQTPDPLANLDFEQGVPGQVPTAWLASPPERTGYTVKLVEEKCEGGQRCAEVAYQKEGPPDPQKFGNVMRSFDAAPYRGKKVRFRAAVRAEVPPLGENQAGLWLRVDRQGGAPGFFDNMMDRPITSPDWKTYEIVGEVAPDAERVNFGLILVGAGKAWLDSASFEIVGETAPAGTTTPQTPQTPQNTPGVGHEPARPLAGRALDNLAAFARLFGYVRYFHPSDQAAAANWDNLAIAGVQAVEEAADPRELARRLEDFFRPVAPTVRVFPTGNPRPSLPPALKPSGDGSPSLTAWEHLGVTVTQSASIYKSTRVAANSPAPASGGALLQYLEAAPFHGKKVRLRASAKAAVSGSHKASMTLKLIQQGQEGPVLAESGDQPITAGTWRTYEIVGNVPLHSEALLVELRLSSEGSVWWDDVSLEAVDEQPPAKPALANPGFEKVSPKDPEGAPDGWYLARDQRRAGYDAELSDDRAGGSHSVRFSFTRTSHEDLSDPAEPFVADLGGGVSAMVPLALYRDREGTLPRVPADTKPPAPAKPAGFTPSGNDRATRLADVVLAWNVFQHFYPYFDVVPTDWMAELPKALTAAATDADERAFQKTLRRLVAALQDGHGGVFHNGLRYTHRLPLAWDWVEDQLVVTHVDPALAPGINRGDVVVSIDGRPAREALGAIEELISGATLQWRRWRALAELASGDQGSQARLELRRPSGEAFTTTLARTAPTHGPGSPEEPRPEKIAEIRPGIWYVDIGRINDQDFQGAVESLAKAKGVIFDLRGYPSTLSTIAIAHLTAQPVTSARWNIPVVRLPDRREMTWDFSNWTVEPAEPRIQGKAAFLIDGRAISYAETYMGIIEHYKLAEIVGGPTAGTNGNVNPFALPGGYRISWTGMQVLKHDGSRHHGIGIQPTVPVSRTLAGVAAGRDEILEKAIEIVRH
jgi:C-terminal processing protease CtpA/Prc